MVTERRMGEPKTEAERVTTHETLYGESTPPPRGTGLSNPGHNPGKMPVRVEKHVKAAGGTYDYVYSDVVPPGELYCLQGIAYENETGARGTFRRGIERNGAYMWLAEHTTPGAAELVFTDKVLWLIPGERLVVRQASCTANDVLSLYAHGYKVLSKFIPGGE